MVDRVRPDSIRIRAARGPRSMSALAGFEFLVAVADERRGRYTWPKIRAGAGPERPQYRSRGTRVDVITTALLRAEPAATPIEIEEAIRKRMDEILILFLDLESAPAASGAQRDAT